MQSITAKQAIDFFEQAPDMPNTNKIAGHMCPYISDSVRRAAISAYELYQNGTTDDKSIAVQLLTEPAYHGVLNPYALNIDSDIQKAVTANITAKFREKGA